ncbi:hypothetical protein [Nonomuraea endophytica]|uniref:Uncharacterized protein n=1 Tax=Nonomuraea endophytica TaxID=714136 RepID=A0A7W8A808_9ACTN|nr:hypothetical protein [Nonomuraea endophytica]MBB5081322.1 hypothetical protein [Nonomuraea endophytica]
MIRQVFVADTPFSPEQIYHQVSLTELTLVVGQLRVPASGGDLSALVDAERIADKLGRVVAAYHRDLKIRIGQLQRADEQRATAPALCACGQPAEPGITHQTDAPCYRDESRTAATLEPESALGDIDPHLAKVVDRVFATPTHEATQPAS